MGDGLRVLLVSGEYPPMEGGVADFTRILGEEMVAQGAEVHVLISRAAGEGTADGTITRHAVMDDWGWRAVYGGLRRAVRDVRPDVVNIQYQTAAYGLHPAVNLSPLAVRPLPVVTTFHDLLVPYLFPKAGPLRWWANLALARLSAACIVTNAQDHALLARHRGVRRLELVPIGSNVPCAPPEGDRASWRARWGVPPQALTLCYFGFLNASKGGEELIDALRLLRQRGADPYLMMIGGVVGASDSTNRAYLQQVRERIDAYGLADRVVWTGHLASPDVSAAFRSSDLCVLPYRDGASYRRGSLMAALTHGMAIVTTRPVVEQPGLRHGENVWLVPPRDARALAEACLYLAGDGPLREGLGRGAEALSKQFAWPAIAARTMEVYRAVARR